MKKLFWVLLHSMTAVLFISGLISYFGVPNLEQSTKAAPTTLVAGATTFRINADSANPNNVLNLVNKLRKDNGLTPLVGDPRLTDLAEARAVDMANRDYYGHKNPDGSNFYDIMQDGGYAPSYACENLSLEPSSKDSASFESWYISSNGHRECMLNPSVSRAGYASRKLYDIPTNDGLTPYYLVVAIHGSAN